MKTSKKKAKTTRLEKTHRAENENGEGHVQTEEPS
jgi:hypothetical protein